MGRGEDDRGVSEVISYALVFSLILVSVSIVSVSGVNVLNDVRTGEQVQNAARAFDVLGNNMEDVYAEGAPSRATEIDLGDGEIYFAQPTTFNVTVQYGSGVTENWTREVRPIVYRVTPENDLVYENGAVFQTRRGSGTIRREPPQLFGADRTLLPLIRTRSDGTNSIGSTTVLVRAELDYRAIFSSGADVDRLWVNVTSPRATLWQRYYEEEVQRTVGDCDSPADDRVVCEIDPGSSVHLTQYNLDVSLVR